MEVKKSQLQEALGIVKPGLAQKEVIEQSTSFAFINGRVVTYNDEISLSHPVEGLDIEGAVESDKLYQLLTKLKQEEITLEIKGNEIQITAGKAKAGLTLQTEVRLPLDQEVSTRGKWKKLPEDFVKHVAFALPSVATNKLQGNLRAVHVNQEGFIEASDGYRLAHCDLATQMPVATFLLPSDSAALMVRLNPVSIAEGKGWIHFKTATGTVLSARILAEDTYPETDKLLDFEGTPVTFPKSILDVMERAAIFTDLNMEVTLAAKKLAIKARIDLGWYSEEVNAKYDGEPIKFAVKPKMLMGILSETQTGELVKGKLKFTGENWVYLTVLQAL